MSTLNDWLNLIGKPKNYNYEKSVKLIKKYSFDEFDGELYLQSNGISPSGEVTFQKVFVAIPKNLKGKVPAVAVPFYHYEGTLGFFPDTMEVFEKFKDNATLVDLVKRGYIAATAHAYHLTYVPENKSDLMDFTRWKVAGEALNKAHPEWSGVGKLIYDTKLMIDLLYSDPRVDGDKIGIMGHSLGGKMAYYTGCLDDRIKVIVASDFGLLWEQTNWEAVWYWGDKLDILKSKNMNNIDLLSFVAPKPFCLLAGLYDNDLSRETLYSLDGYKENQSNLFVVNHATGHRPPKYAKDAGYGFIDYHLKGIVW